MEESSWAATPYESRAFNKKQIIKSRDLGVLLLTFKRVAIDCNNGDYVYDYYANVIMAGPKERIIASALINDFDLWDKGNLRLIINILVNSLDKALDDYDMGTGTSFSKARAEQKQFLVVFMDSIADKTFIVVRSARREIHEQHLFDDSNAKRGPKKKISKKQKKALKKDDEVEDALKCFWNLSDYKMVYPDELMEFRNASSGDYFFWVNIEVNSCVRIHFGADRNHLLSTDGDKVLAAIYGKGKLTLPTINKIRQMLTYRHKLFKNQLAAQK